MQKPKRIVRRCEIEAVESLMTEIAKDGLGTYGPNEVMSAAMTGAVDRLLILDTKIRERNLDDIVVLWNRRKAP